MSLTVSEYVSRYTRERQAGQTLAEWAGKWTADYIHWARFYHLERAYEHNRSEGGQGNCCPCGGGE